MGIRTVMITGDNPVTAAAIAAEAGVDDFLAQATPEAKLKLIRQNQAGGRLVAMTGDGTNDAPALAQALEGFSYKEIADILEVPVGTVMSRLYRGRRMLERTLLRYGRRYNYITAPPEKLWDDKIDLDEFFGARVAAS